MKVVILAGGYGTRLAEETVGMPKPLIAVGEYPILWHIMKVYSHYGFNEFVICLGYKGYKIKEYFANYFLYHSDVTFDFSRADGGVVHHSKKAEPWKVTLVDTGLNTQTGGRVRRIKQYTEDKPFFLTYGDTVSDINVDDLLKTHKSHSGVATVTAVQPPGKWGALRLDADHKVVKFEEKPAGDGEWINGGFFVLNQGVFDYLDKGDETVWEREPLEKLAADGNLSAYYHKGFWQPMDTLRNKRDLEKHWNTPNPPWKIW